MERRSFSVLEFRVLREEGQPPKLAGHAAVFNTLSEEMWGFREKIAPGAFAKTLGGDVRALFNHDPNIVLGRTLSKTLTLREDEIGLAVEITPPDTQAARDVVTVVERGDVSQMSFGFRTLRQEWDETQDPVIRTLVEIELFDVSPVTFPAYPETNVAVRALEAWRAERKQHREIRPPLDLYRRRLRLLGK